MRGRSSMACIERPFFDLSVIPGPLDRIYVMAMERATPNSQVTEAEKHILDWDRIYLDLAPRVHRRYVRVHTTRRIPRCCFGRRRCLRGGALLSCRCAPLRSGLQIAVDTGVEPVIISSRPARNHRELMPRASPGPRTVPIAGRVDHRPHIQRSG